MSVKGWKSAWVREAVWMLAMVWKSAWAREAV
jgi:hypothetical protein